MERVKIKNFLRNEKFRDQKASIIVDPIKANGQ